MANASDQRCVAVLLRPFDCFSLRLEGGKKVVGMVLDNIVVDGVSLGPTLWTRLDIDVDMVLSRAVRLVSFISVYFWPVPLLAMRASARDDPRLRPLLAKRVQFVVVRDVEEAA
jgi:hypothetical protein